MIVTSFTNDGQAGAIVAFSVTSGGLLWPHDEEIVMLIGAGRLTFHLHGNDTLKGKRQVSRSLITRLRQRFNLAVAEIDGIDEHRRLVVGLTCVSNEQHHANEMIDQAIKFAYAQHLDAELVEVRRDIIEGV